MDQIQLKVVFFWSSSSQINNQKKDALETWVLNPQTHPAHIFCRARF